MSTIVARCPKCGAEMMTFDCFAVNPVRATARSEIKLIEVFCVCRSCRQGTVFEALWHSSLNFTNLTLGLDINFGVLSDHLSVIGPTTDKPKIGRALPEHLPESIRPVYFEGLVCHSVGCLNAAATMFRLCLDLATSEILGRKGNEAVLKKTRGQMLGARLPIMFDEGLLPSYLSKLSFCIKKEGDIGAHYGLVGQNELENIIDFTEHLLEEIYTRPEKLRLTEESQMNRKSAGGSTP